MSNHWQKLVAEIFPLFKMSKINVQSEPTFVFPSSLVRKLMQCPCVGDTPRFPNLSKQEGVETTTVMIRHDKVMSDSGFKTA